MGFILTLIYIVLTIISPEQFGREWASYQPMVWLGAITALASIPNMLTDGRLRSSVQTRLMLGFMLAIALSELMSGRFQGAVDASRAILPSAVVFFFIVANVTTVRRLKIITATTVVVCLGVAAEALCGYYYGFRSDIFVLPDGPLLRLRAAGFLNDPNDFGQMLLIALPLIFIGWNRGRAIASSLVVFVPSAFLLWATYLTHSRGALIAVGVLILMACQKSIGKTASVVLSGALVFGLMALNFTGGRDISAAGGADRLELWSSGLQLFKSAPLFGVGFGRFTDFYDHTAHNSFVLCLAELGAVGSTMLVALFVTTLMSLNRMINAEEQSATDLDSVGGLEIEGQATPSDWEASFREPETAKVAAALYGVGTELEADQESVAVQRFEEWEPSYDLHWGVEGATKGELEAGAGDDQEHHALKSFAVVMRLALISFLTTSFFLSRSYVATIYLVLGLATATILLEPKAAKSDGRHRWVLVTAAVEASAILFIYLVVRLRF